MGFVLRKDEYQFEVDEKMAYKRIEQAIYPV